MNIRDQEINKKEQEIRNKEQQITTLVENLNEMQHKYLSEVDVSTQSIDQLGKDIEKKVLLSFTLLLYYFILCFIIDYYFEFYIIFLLS